MARITITTTISSEMHALAKKNKLRWHDALATGIRMMSGQKTLITEELNDLKVSVKKLNSVVEFYKQKYFELVEKMTEVKKDV